MIFLSQRTEKLIDTINNEMIKRFKELPSGKKYSRNLFKAFKLDASNKKYKIWKELIFYCKFSANPVGRFVIDAVNEKQNIKKIKMKFMMPQIILCTALQIINHIQDCQKDFKELK